VGACNVARSFCTLSPEPRDGGRGRGSLVTSLGGGLFLAHLLSLSGDTLLLADGVLGTTGFSLGLEFDLSLLLSLLLVDGLDQNVLVLVEVTLGAHVESVVHSPVNFLSVSISAEESTENSLSAHPDKFAGHTGVLGSLSASHSLMAASALGSVPSLAAGSGVDRDLASHDQVVLRKFANVLAGVGEGNFAGLVGVHPDSLSTALKHCSG